MGRGIAVWITCGALLAAAPSAEAKRRVTLIFDEDGDGLPDDSDQCPAEAGDLAHGGCPTTPRTPTVGGACTGTITESLRAGLTGTVTVACDGGPVVQVGTPPGRFVPAGMSQGQAGRLTWDAQVWTSWEPASGGLLVPTTEGGWKVPAAEGYCIGSAEPFTPGSVQPIHVQCADGSNLELRMPAQRVPLTAASTHTVSGLFRWRADGGWAGMNGAGTDGVALSLVPEAVVATPTPPPDPARDAPPASGSCVGKLDSYGEQDVWFTCDGQASARFRYPLTLGPSRTPPPVGTRGTLTWQPFYIWPEGGQPTVAGRAWTSLVGAGGRWTPASVMDGIFDQMDEE